MKTGQFVAATAGAGIVGGIAGAWLFLTFYADSFRPKDVVKGPAPAAEFQFTAEEEAALRKLPRRVDELAGSLDAIRPRGGSGPAAGAGRPAGAGPGAPDLTGSPIIEVNEKAAIATLRNLTSAEAMIQCSGKIDCDNDGIGEFGTFLEMTGTVGVRKGTDRSSPLGSDFSVQGTPVTPAILAPSLAAVDAEGRVLKNGYYFQIFLPDTQSPSGFVHETAGPSLAGGSGRVGVDYAETTWCCYAWPAEKGKTGNRAFFVNQAGDVLQSANDGGHHKDGSAFDPLSAYRGGGITAQIAVGTAGRDGDVWKVTN